MTTKNAPTADPLGRARSGLGIAALGVAALFLWWGGATFASRFVSLPEPVVEAAEWSYVGMGDDVSTAFDVERPETFRVEWFSPCGASVSLNEWDGTTILRSIPLGDSDDAEKVVALTPGIWYVDVYSECRWGVRVSPT